MIYPTKTLSFLLPLGVAAGNVWQESSLGHYTNLMGVYASKPNEAHYSLVDQRAGSGVFVTQDYAVTGELFGPAGAMNMDIALSSDQKIACLVGLGGVFMGAPYNGNFTKVENVRVVTQSVESFSSQSFGITGTFSLPDRTNVNGVMISTDNGVTWSTYDVGAYDPYVLAARYGAFPSESTWYVATGSWLYASDAYGKQLTSRTVQRNGKFEFVTPQPMLTDSNTTGYNGGIFKTTDTGKSFELVYRTTQMYFNQIHCADTDHCMGVGENDNAAFVMSTKDGGVSWDTVYTGPTYMSLAAVRMLSVDEIWVGGGIMSPKSVEGHYLHSVDGGASWEDTIMNGMVFDMSFNGGIGYATYMTPSYTSSTVYK